MELGVKVSAQDTSDWGRQEDRWHGPPFDFLLERACLAAQKTLGRQGSWVDGCLGSVFPPLHTPPPWPFSLLAEQNCERLCTICGQLVLFRSMRSALGNEAAWPGARQLQTCSCQALGSCWPACQAFARGPEVFCPLPPPLPLQAGKAQLGIGLIYLQGVAFCPCHTSAQTRRPGDKAPAQWGFRISPSRDTLG
jgi:hypothetical protein